MVDFNGEGRVILTIDPDNCAFQPVSRSEKDPPNYYIKVFIDSFEPFVKRNDWKNFKIVDHRQQDINERRSNETRSRNVISVTKKLTSLIHVAVLSTFCP